MATATKAVPFSQVKVNFAQARKHDDLTASGKQLRNYIRGNFDYLRETFSWPQEGKENRDGNRYADVPVKLAEMIGSGKLPTRKTPAGKRHIEVSITP
jgi:hypothetical protein